MINQGAFSINWDTVAKEKIHDDQLAYLLFTEKKVIDRLDMFGITGELISRGTAKGEDKLILHNIIFESIFILNRC